MPAVAEGLINLSVVCAVLAVIGAFGYDFYLASTQWILVGILLGIWGVYLLAVAHFRLSR